LELLLEVIPQPEGIRRIAFLGQGFQSSGEGSQWVSSQIGRPASNPMGFPAYGFSIASLEGLVDELALGLHGLDKLMQGLFQQRTIPAKIFQGFFVSQG
jgi:hypothetical protein